MGGESQKFCDEHAIDGFPTVVLTGGLHPPRICKTVKARFWPHLRESRPDSGHT